MLFLSVLCAELTGDVRILSTHCEYPTSRDHEAQRRYPLAGEGGR